LLAMRVAWDLVLWRHFEARHPRIFRTIKQQMLAQFIQYEGLYDQHKEDQAKFWVWQRALELSFQRPLQRQLLSPAATVTGLPKLQAAFCIDVRSEPMRRALEAQDPSIQTLGFAGFFGLPLEYALSSEGYTRPQLPGLLKPSIRATQSEVSARTEAQQKALARRVAVHDAKAAAPSTFGLVEALGVGKAFSLLKNSVLADRPEHAINHIESGGRWRLSRGGENLTLNEQVQLAAGILGAMGLTANFAPWILLLGHGSRTANNPQAAALDCGACGGQTGEVNVKVLAQLLNDNDVRLGLADQGIVIPEDTRVIPGLHNTTTDAITCFGVDENESWQRWTKAATDYAQRQRASSVGIHDSNSGKIAQRFERRSRDWAEIRPEWGLVNNAAFIVAPRARTKNIDLKGRCFLHDYQWQQDADFKVLELIMTAPMVVTNWINLQYYASVTDNEKYGSGNKLLHNVVGGHIGVFEGNGGDLRIGLAKQSLHDGKHWRHQPLRLSVYIASPKAAMTRVIEQHQAVADLIRNQWLYLFHLDDDGKSMWQFVGGDWQHLDAV